MGPGLVGTAALAQEEGTVVGRPDLELPVYRLQRDLLGHVLAEALGARLGRDLRRADRETAVRRRNTATTRPGRFTMRSSSQSMTRW